MTAMMPADSQGVPSSSEDLSRVHEDIQALLKRADALEYQGQLSDELALKLSRLAMMYFDPHKDFNAVSRLYTEIMEALPVEKRG